MYFKLLLLKCQVDFNLSHVDFIISHLLVAHGKFSMYALSVAR